MIISSTQNKLVKDVLKLQKAAVRKSERLAYVEGAREVSLAIQYGYTIETLFFCDEFYTLDEAYPIDENKAESLVHVTPEVYRKMSYREGTEGVSAIIKTPVMDMIEGELSNKSTVLVLESLEKPGNIGAILRTADASGVDTVILCNPVCDVYNPNLIRSSLGCVFTMQIFVMTSEECIAKLNQAGFEILSASLQTDSNFYDEKLIGKTALVFGSESHGLSNIWYTKSKAVKIPMYGKIDSLNVSATVSAMLFEVVRQKLL